jgi:hypothetical protein
MKSYKTIISAAAAGLALAAVSGNAQVLNLQSDGTIPAGGTLVNQELVGVSPSGNVGANNGTISTWVVNDPDVDASGLIFIYQVKNEGVDGIDQVEVTGFTASEILTGTGDYNSLSGTGALTFGSTPTVGTGGNTTAFATLNFVAPNALNFDTATIPGTFTSEDLGVGGISDYLVVFTDVTSFQESYGQTQDSFTGQGNILAPVPEANTIAAGALMLLPLGIGAVRALRKERTA